jgi:cell division protease FtsH
MMRLGGRAVDTVLGEGPCAGSSSDLAAATATLVAAETQFGIGSSLISYAADVPVVQLLAHEPELRRLVGMKLDELWARTLALVRDNEAAIRRLADALLARRILTHAEVEQVLAGTGPRGKTVKRVNDQAPAPRISTNSNPSQEPS